MNDLVCPECDCSVKSYSDFKNTDGKLCYHAYVCGDCYKELESDEE